MVRVFLLGSLLLGTPLAAQSGPALPGAPRVVDQSAAGEVSREAPINGVLTLYGNQRCPTDSVGNEVVVCVRRSAAEQFRMPKDLREFKVTPQNESWAARLAPTLEAGATGTGSCTVVGPGGGIGCMQQQFRKARREDQEREAEAAQIP